MPLLLSPAISLAWLPVEMVLETPGQYHFVSTLAPLPARTANSLSLSNHRKPTPTPGCQAYMMPISRVDLVTI